MWTCAQRDIGGALCWMLLSKLRKCRSGTIWGRKKTLRRSQQLQGRRMRNLEVMVRKTRSLTICFSWSICTIVELLGNIGKFSPVKMRNMKTYYKNTLFL